MATGWPFNTPRRWDFNFKGNNPAVSRGQLFSYNAWLGGISLKNDTDNDIKVIFTDNDIILVEVKIVKAHDSARIPGIDLEEVVGLWIEPNFANLSYHVWGWQA